MFKKTSYFHFLFPNFFGRFFGVFMCGISFFPFTLTQAQLRPDYSFGLSGFGDLTHEMADKLKSYADKNIGYQPAADLTKMGIEKAMAQYKEEMNKLLSNQIKVLSKGMRKQIQPYYDKATSSRKPIAPNISGTSSALASGGKGFQSPCKSPDGSPNEAEKPGSSCQTEVATRNLLNQYALNVAHCEEDSRCLSYQFCEYNPDRCKVLSFNFLFPVAYAVGKPPTMGELDHFKKKFSRMAHNFLENARNSTDESNRQFQQFEKEYNQHLWNRVEKAWESKKNALAQQIRECMSKMPEKFQNAASQAHYPTGGME